MNPILPRIKQKTGSWNTTPIIKVRVVNVEIYELRLIVLTISSSTWYVPKNWNEIGNRTK